MSDDTIQLVAVAVLAIYQVYATQQTPVFAYVWDIIATVCGQIANFLAHISMRARANYYEAVNAYGA